LHFFGKECIITITANKPCSIFKLKKEIKNDVFN